MKRLFALVIISVLFAFSAVPAYAANEGAINQYEKEVIDFVKAGKTRGNGFFFKDPDITAMTNFFKTIDMTEQQKDNVIRCLNEAIAIFEADSAAFKGDVRALSYETKKKLIDKADETVGHVGLDAVYDASDRLLKFKKDNVVVYQTEPTLIKQTGSNTYLILLVVLGSALTLSLGALAINQKIRKA